MDGVVRPGTVAEVQALVKRLMDSGDVYLGTFEGWYDAGQEEYYTETKARDVEYTSPISGKPLERATEENYYFRLSATWPCFCKSEQVPKQGSDWPASKKS